MKLIIDIAPMASKLPERFKKKIEFTETCWIWKTGKFKNGYGQYWSEGKGISAHRFSWIKVFGEIPNGLFVLHKCDTPECVNPDHLFLGTLQDNSADMKKKGRAAKGQNNGNAKLTKELVAEIRKNYVRGTAGFASEVSLSAMSRKYGVGKSTLSSIVNNRIWVEKERREAR